MSSCPGETIHSFGNNDSQKITDYWSRKEKAGAGTASERVLALGVPLFDDERADVVPGLVVVFGVGAVAVRKLQPQLHNVRGGKTQLLLSNLPFVLNKPKCLSYESQSVCV